MTGAVLRRIPLATIRDRAASLIAFVGDQPFIQISKDAPPVSVFPSAETPHRRKLVRAACTRRQRPGRPRLKDAIIFRAAEAYLRHYNNGVHRGLLQKVADELGVPLKTAADHVRRARSAGFLSQGERGRAGATPGPRFQEFVDARGGSEPII